jgi:hypothetical protein
LAKAAWKQGAFQRGNPLQTLPLPRRIHRPHSWSVSLGHVSVRSRPQQLVVFELRVEMISGGNDAVWSRNAYIVPVNSEQGNDDEVR